MLMIAVLLSGFTEFPDTTNRSAAGNFLKVPVLIGNNADEGDVFETATELLQFNKTNPLLTFPVADLLTAVGSLFIFWTLLTYSTQVAFSCPASQATSDRVKAGVPTYRYRYEGHYCCALSGPHCELIVSFQLSSQTSAPYRRYEHSTAPRFQSSLVPSAYLVTARFRRPPMRLL